MRILLANYRYFVSGGAERYLFAVKTGLESRGHEVVPFSVNYTRTEPTAYQSYFVPPLAGGDELRVRDHAWSLSSAAKTIERSFYSKEVEESVARLVEDTRPDVAYVLHFLKKLSPALLVGLKRRGLPIVARLSDVLLLCPEAHFLRDGSVCTLCASGSRWPSVRHGCVQGSHAGSLVHYFAHRYHERKGFFDLIDRFVVPSQTTLDWMVRSGWSQDRFQLLPTFVSDRFFEPATEPADPASPYILYVGHIESHKGIDTLIRAYALAQASGLPRLKIAGGLSSPFARTCRELTRELSLESQVDFLDFVGDDDLPALYRGARLTVVPSRCYENLPNVLIESYASGTAVIGSAHGSIEALIEPGVTGDTFIPGDANDLAAKLRDRGGDASWCETAGRAARGYAEREHGKDRHLENLERVFRDVGDN